MSKEIDIHTQDTKPSWIWFSGCVDAFARQELDANGGERSANRMHVGGEHTIDGYLINHRHGRGHL